MISNPFTKTGFIWIILLIAAAIVVLFLPWFWRMLYPLPYRDTIFSNAQEAGVDPYLTMAVIRVESKFRPMAQSVRGAKGLMQLMPETAQWVIKQMGEKFDEKLLFDVDYNTKIGCWYLAYLIKEFNGELHLALASYNGGPNNVKQWIKDEIWNGKLEQLTDIPFPETKDFVEKVLYDYNTYRQIYSWHVSFVRKAGFLVETKNMNSLTAELRGGTFGQ